MRKAFKTSVSALLTAAVFLAVSCGGGDKPVSPIAPFQPEVVNLDDSFSFQATALDGVSGTVSYMWNNTGSQATINHSSAVDSGTVTVTILDANGTQVYGNPLVASLNEQTSVGAPGAWTITVALTDVWGTLNFTAQKFVAVP